MRMKNTLGLILIVRFATFDKKREREVKSLNVKLNKAVEPKVT